MGNCLWLETFDSFIAGKLLLLGKSRELLLLLSLVLSNYLRARWVIAELKEYMGILLQFQLEQLSVKSLHWRYPPHIWHAVLDVWTLTMKLVGLAKVTWANLSNFALEQSESIHTTGSGGSAGGGNLKKG